MTFRLPAPPAAKLWAKAAHDLMQPIQALLFLTQVLRQSGDADRRTLVVDKMEQDRMSVALQGQMCLLTDVLKFESVTLTPVDLAEIHDAAMHDIEAGAEEGSFAVCSRRPRSRVPSHAAMLRLVVEGLVANALRLNRQGDIFAGWRERPDCARFEVYYRAAPLLPAQATGALVLARRRDQRQQACLGLGAIALLCQALGHGLEATSLPRGGQRLALVVSR